MLIMELGFVFASQFRFHFASSLPNCVFQCRVGIKHENATTRHWEMCALGSQSIIDGITVRTRHDIGFGLCRVLSI